ncbi:MAG: MFS transporter, partial [Candidatus Bathyarchaeia archaeon]
RNGWRDFRPQFLLGGVCNRGLVLSRVERGAVESKGRVGRWLILGLSFAMFFMCSGGVTLFPISLLPISREMGWSTSTLSQAMSVFMLFTGISMLTSGKMTDKYGPRLISLLGHAIASISTLLISFITEVWQVYLLYGVLLGITWQGTNVVALTTLISEWFAERRSLPLSILHSARPLGWFCMASVAGSLIWSYGWRPMWLLTGLIYILIVIVSAFFINEPEGSTSIPGSGGFGGPSTKAAVKTSFFITLGWLLFLCGITDLPFSQLWMPISVEWGVSEVVASHWFGFLALAVFTGTIVTGPLQRRLGYNISLSAIYTIRFFSLITALLSIKSILGYYIFTVLLGISFFGMVPLSSAWVGEVFGEKIMGGLLGLLHFAHFVGTSLGIYFFSLINDIYGTYYPAFLLSSLISMVKVILSYMIKPPA